MFDFKISLYGLCFQCPFEEELSTCQLRTIREKGSYLEKTKYIDSLSKIDRIEMFIEHKKCLTKRESDLNMTKGNVYESINRNY